MSVQLHCGSCPEDCAGCTDEERDTCSKCDSVHLKSCSGTDRNGNAVKLAHCSSHDTDPVGLARVHLTHCSGEDKDGHVVKLGHCFGGHDEDEHTR